MTLHAQLSAGRWQTFGLAEQLANVGSEVERAIQAWRSGRSERFDKALDRALELFDLTARDGRWSGHRRREILRAREEFVRLFFDLPHDAASAEGLRGYFLAFALLRQRSASEGGEAPGTSFGREGARPERSRTAAEVVRESPPGSQPIADS